MKMAITLMMSTKLAFPGLLEIKVFEKKGHHVRIPNYEVTNKILPCNSNYIVDMII